MFAGEMRDRGTFAAMCPARRRSIEAAQDGPVGKVRATRGLFGADWNVDAQTDDYRSRGRCRERAGQAMPSASHANFSSRSGSVEHGIWARSWAAIDGAAFSLPAICA
jgi:hypothetical protein